MNNLTAWRLHWTLQPFALTLVTPAEDYPLQLSWPPDASMWVDVWVALVCLHSYADLHIASPRRHDLIPCTSNVPCPCVWQCALPVWPYTRHLSHFSMEERGVWGLCGKNIPVMAAHLRKTLQVNMVHHKIGGWGITLATGPLFSRNCRCFSQGPLWYCSV